jgi:cation diffusion facilitator CzcD-associated flavoprotein CzcO
MFRLSADSPDFDAVVVGAGFSGLYMLHRLRNLLGLSVRVFETGGGVGGTWYWNRYPGARCDSESYFYAFSFSEELQQEWDWTCKYPEQPEILRYLEHVADRFDLRRDIQLNTRVAAARYQDARDCWEIDTDGGETVTARFLIMGVGCLSAVNAPQIPGLDRFEGRCYYTAAWPHEGVDFAGTRVGLIGTGSSGIQSAPVIAAAADHLTVFQRTPNYTIPALNAPLTPNRLQEIRATYPAIRRKQRESAGGLPYDQRDRSALSVSPEERRAIYEQLWNTAGGLQLLFGSFNDISINPEANETVCAFIRSKIREIVKDPATAAKLSPTYPYGTKRPPIDTGYYETFNRENVTLVDLQETPITEITPTGIRTAGGDHDLDIIVFATGFDAITGALLRIDIRGRHGLSLQEKWEDGPLTYLGLQTAGFPNLFIITGAGSPGVVTNVPTAIEHHVEWIADCIAYLREHGSIGIEATEAAEHAWTEHAREVGDASLLSKGNSFYVGANIPGKKRILLPYVGGLGRYIARCAEVAANGYEGFSVLAAGAATAPSAPAERMGTAR